jgi:hypothetical protein
MKIMIKIQVEADQVACIGGEWFCGNNCPFNNTNLKYCCLFRQKMSRRLPECIAMQEWSETGGRP